VKSQSPKVLLVDDVPENLVALEALLRVDGVESLCARSGREALELLLVHEVALALVDVQMPEMDGFELAELMRGSARTRQVPIIFITAAGEEARRVFAGYEAGAVDFLFKPVNEQVLRSKCSVFLELNRRHNELQEQLRLNELLMAAVGHDLRNPLSAVLMASELLQEMCDDPEQLRVVKRIRSSGKHMTRLIDDLFDTARVRLDKGGIVLDRTDSDLHLIADTVVAELATGSGRRELQVSAKGNTTGTWDRERLTRVLSNLVGNAVRHGKHNTAIRVEVDGEASGEVTVRVSNQGEIPRELLPQLWEPFKRSKATHGAAKPGGLGLGLYIVKQIALAHGGTVDAFVGSDMTTFELRVPRHAPEIAPA
jgi:signal transduction histidine kinase